MQPLVSAELMRDLDRTAIERFGIPGVVLMENAGRSVAAEMLQRIAGLQRKTITIVCGKGNNGGDGFVVARHLANAGCRVRVVVLEKPNRLSPDAAIHAKTAATMGRSGGITMRHAVGPRGLAAEPHPEVVVDAIFGTGFSGTPAGVAGAAIRWINTSGAYVVAVDIPSGVHGSTGNASGEAVRADLTVALAMAKTGNVVGAGYECGGTLVIGDIGLPSGVMAKTKFPAWRVQEQDVAAVLPARPLRAHKYSAGKVFVLAGSRTFTGAAALCAEAALRSGAGAVVLGIPASIHHVLAKKLTEVILLPLPETPGGTIAGRALEELLKRCSWADAVAIGPGIGRNAETDALVQELVGDVDRPMVIDADALTAMAGGGGTLRRKGSLRLVTPHTGELSRLTGAPAGAIDADPLSSAVNAARKLGCAVALKGAPTMVTAPGRELMVNGTGNPGMATIGSGDVLTGLVAGLCAQGMELFPAAWAGVFIHGRAGDLAAARLGQRSMLAGDILDHVPGALRSCEL
jgi:ADP-dependent NAD(P)H-hydrate dehydratase / NAD(P)H-hydrate epimerase